MIAVFDRAWCWDNNSLELGKPTFPEELLIKIFSYLPQNEIGCHLPLVCYTWKEVSQDQSLWKNAYFSRLSPFLHLVARASEVSYKKAIKSLIAANLIKSAFFKAMLHDWVDSNTLTIGQYILTVDQLNERKFVQLFMACLAGGMVLFKKLPPIRLSESHKIHKLDIYDIPQNTLARINILGVDRGIVFNIKGWLKAIYFNDKNDLMTTIVGEPECCLVKHYDPPQFNFDYEVYKNFTKAI